MTVCYIGLGSNLGQPLNQLKSAKKAINLMSMTSVIAASSIYKSQALTLDDLPQNDYLNAVLKIDTALTAQALLDELQKLEHAQGRVRQKRWGARTIDLDILLFADEVIQTDRLWLPHKELENRRFVLLPLQQIAGNIHISGSVTINQLVKNTEHQVLEKVAEFSCGELNA